MKREIDCQVFEDRLDAFSAGELTQAEIESMRLHAAECPVCAVQLGIKEHLSEPSLAELKAGVPEELIGTIWPRLQTEIAESVSPQSRRSSTSPSRSWLVPALAAAGLFLFVCSGLLLWEVASLRERESVLVQQVADQERWLAELDLRTAATPIARTAGLAGSRSWQRVLGRTESITVSELSKLLAGLSPSTTVLDGSAARRLMRRLPILRVTTGRQVVEHTRLEDGLQAGEAVQLLRALDLAPERSISTARFSELSSSS